MTVEGANLHKSCLLIFPLFLMTQVNSLPKNIQHMSIDPLDLLEPLGWNCNFGFWNPHSLKFMRDSQVTPNQRSVCKQKITVGSESHGLKTKGEG